VEKGEMRKTNGITAKEKVNRKFGWITSWNRRWQQFVFNRYGQCRM